jgi:nucleoside-triphosphatase THEP1
MVLEDISSGRAIPISEDRGPGARGCRIDEAELLSAMISALGQLQAKPDILIINKFGKTEAEGRGFRPLIAEAVEQGVPVLIAVPWRNVESWRLFAGELSQEHVLDGILGTDDEICRLLGLNTVPAEATTAVARESPAKRN